MHIYLCIYVYIDNTTTTLGAHNDSQKHSHIHTTVTRSFLPQTHIHICTYTTCTLGAHKNWQTDGGGQHQGC